MLVHDAHWGIWPNILDCSGINIYVSGLSQFSPDMIVSKWQMNWGAQTHWVWYTAQGAHCLRTPTGLQSNRARLKTSPCWVPMTALSHRNPAGALTASRREWDMHCIVKKGYLMYMEQTGEIFMHVIYSACHNVTWKQSVRTVHPVKIHCSKQFSSKTFWRKEVSVGCKLEMW